MKKNEKMSAKYGLTIYNSENKAYPYYVEEWDDCFTKDEIEFHLKDWQSIETMEQGIQ